MGTRIPRPKNRLFRLAYTQNTPSAAPTKSPLSGRIANLRSIGAGFCLEVDRSKIVWNFPHVCANAGYVQNDPNAVPSTITATSARMAPTIATMTMSK